MSNKIKAIFNTEWAEAAFIRAIRTIAQVLLSQIGTNALGITDIDWGAAFSTAILAGIMSLLMSVAGLPEVENVPEYENTKEESSKNKTE